MEHKSKRKVAPKPHDAAKTIRFGLIVLGCSIALGLAPLAIGKSGINKYVVAFAFVGGCLGLLCLLLGAIERLEGQRNDPLPPLPPEESRGEGASDDRMH